MRYFVRVGSDAAEVEVEVERHADGTFLVRGPGGQEARVTSLARHASTHTLSITSQVLEVQTSEGQVKLGLDRFSAHAQSERERAGVRAGSAEAHASSEITAPMPGRILRVTCAAGDTVSKGAPLVVIEAMKMQNELCARADHVVRAVRVAAGDTVDRGDILIELG